MKFQNRQMRNCGVDPQPTELACVSQPIVCWALESSNQNCEERLANWWACHFVGRNSSYGRVALPAVSLHDDLLRDAGRNASPSRRLSFDRSDRQHCSPWGRIEDHRHLAAAGMFIDDRTRIAGRQRPYVVYIHSRRCSIVDPGRRKLSVCPSPSTNAVLIQSTTHLLFSKRTPFMGLLSSCEIIRPLLGAPRTTEHGIGGGRSAGVDHDGQRVPGPPDTLPHPPRYDPMPSKDLST